MSNDPQTTQTSTTTNGDAFGNQPNTNTDTQTTTVITQDPVFTQTVGDGKQYATQEDLAKGKVEADAFIDQLKQENAQMREDLGKRPTMDDIQDIMKLQNENQNNSSELNEEALETIVQSQLKSIQATELAHGNTNRASDYMVELYGDKAAEQVKLKADSLGVSVRYLQDQAAKSPDLFYSIMGVSPNKDASTTIVAGNQTVTGNNTERFDNTPHGTKEGTWGYYEKMRKEDSKKYFTPKVQNEMFQMRKQKDADFYK